MENFCAKRARVRRAFNRQSITLNTEQELEQKICRGYGWEVRKRRGAWGGDWSSTWSRNCNPRDVWELQRELQDREWKQQKRFEFWRERERRLPRPQITPPQNGVRFPCLVIMGPGFSLRCQLQVRITSFGTLGPLHTRAKSRDHEIVSRDQESVQRLSQRHLQNRVLWSQTLKCSVKSYVTGPSTKCYFDEFLFNGFSYMIK